MQHRRSAWAALLAQPLELHVPKPRTMPETGVTPPAVLPNGYAITAAALYKEREKRPSDRANPVQEAKEEACMRLVTDWFGAEFPNSDVRPHVSDALYGFL